MKTTDVNRILGIDEQFKAPARIMEILWNREEREQVFRDFLEVESDVSSDQFHQYFEEEQADRKVNKQDFTPDGIAKLLSAIVGTPDTSDKDGWSCYDPAAGTGGLTIVKWWQDCLKKLPWDYVPHEHFYMCEDLSDRAIPFLLFNLMIRGMNAIVVHGDTLGRENCKGVFFIQNTADNFLGFSDLNVMPYTEQIRREFQIKSWAEEKDRYPAHIESDYPVWMRPVLDAMALEGIDAHIKEAGE